MILPTCPGDLETGDYFEVEIPEMDICVENKIGENRRFMQETIMNIPNLTILCRSETFLSYFPLKICIEIPLFPQESSKTPNFAYMSIDMKAGALVFSTSKEDYRLLLRLFDLNLAYDDYCDRLIVPGAVPPVPGNWSKSTQFALKTDTISVLFKGNQANIAEIVLSGFEISVGMYNDGYLYTILTADMLEILRPKETESTEAENPFQCSETEDTPIHRLPTELLRPLNTLFNGQMLTFHLRKDRFGNKTITAIFSNLQFLLDFAFLQEISNFVFYGFPDYSSGEIDNFAYLHKCRPNFEQSFKVDLDSEWLSPLLDFELTIKDSEFVLPRTTFTCKGTITYEYLKQNEHDLKQRLGKQMNTSTACYAEEFYLISRGQRGESSRNAYEIRLFEPISGQYICKQYQDFVHFPSEKVYKSEVNAGLRDIIMTLTIGDLYQFWRFYVHQSSLISLRKPVIDSLTQKNPNNERNPFELVTQRQSLMSVSQGLESVTDSQISVEMAINRSVLESNGLSAPPNIFLYTVNSLDIMLIDDTNGIYKSLLWLKGRNEEYKGEEDPNSHSQSLLRASLQVHLYNPISDV